jgi:hypothetical protein
MLLAPCSVRIEHVPEEPPVILQGEIPLTRAIHPPEITPQKWAESLNCRSWEDSTTDTNDGQLEPSLPL